MSELNKNIIELMNRITRHNVTESGPAPAEIAQAISAIKEDGLVAKITANLGEARKEESVLRSFREEVSKAASAIIRDDFTQAATHIEEAMRLYEELSENESLQAEDGEISENILSDLTALNNLINKRILTEKEVQKAINDIKIAYKELSEAVKNGKQKEALEQISKIKGILGTLRTGNLSKDTKVVNALTRAIDSLSKMGSRNVSARDVAAVRKELITALSIIDTRHTTSRRGDIEKELLSVTAGSMPSVEPYNAGLFGAAPSLVAPPTSVGHIALGEAQARDNARGVALTMVEDLRGAQDENTATVVFIDTNTGNVAQRERMISILKMMGMDVLLVNMKETRFSELLDQFNARAEMHRRRGATEVRAFAIMAQSTAKPDIIDMLRTNKVGIGVMAKGISWATVLHSYVSYHKDNDVIVMGMTKRQSDKLYSKSKKDMKIEVVETDIYKNTEEEFLNEFESELAY